MVLLLAVLGVRGWLLSHFDAANCSGIGLGFLAFSFSFGHCSLLDDDSMLSFGSNMDTAVQVEQVVLLRLPGVPPDTTAKACPDRLCDNHHMI